MATREQSEATSPHMPRDTSTFGAAPTHHRRLLRQDVYEMLLHELVSGSLPPGQHIRDDELAQRLNVSRTPVREALAQLETAGLIETAPNRYTRVTPLYSDDLDVTLEALAALYPLALRETMSNLSETDEFELEVFARRLGNAQRPDMHLIVAALGRFCAARLTSRTLSQLISTTQPRLLRVLALDPNVLAQDFPAAIQQLVNIVRARDLGCLASHFQDLFTPIRAGIQAAMQGSPGADGRNESSYR